jgi:hypothetical protein
MPQSPAVIGSAKREGAERRTGVRRAARGADTNLTHRVRDGVILLIPSSAVFSGPGVFASHRREVYTKV